MSNIKRNLSEILLDGAKYSLSIQQDDGSFPSGHNGPYNDLETPVRNTSHWLITLCDVYKSKNSEAIYTAAENAASYLLSNDARPYSETFYHRKSKDKDKCNGLIGQAWTIEALAIAANTLRDPNLIDIAQEVFLKHPFNYEFALWKRVEIDGNMIGFDYTFNHQLWFAAAGSELAQHGCPEVENQVLRFLDNLGKLFDLADLNTVYHLLNLNISPLAINRTIKESDFRELYINNLLNYARQKSQKEKLRKKSIGYHSFNLYALGILRENYSNHSCWNLEKIKSVVDCISNTEYKQDVKNNKYAFSFNPTGIENAYAIEVFSENNKQECLTWVKSQFDRHITSSQQIMNKNTTDPATLAARIYEAVRLPNYSINFEKETTLMQS